MYRINKFRKEKCGGGVGCWGFGGGGGPPKKKKKQKKKQCDDPKKMRYKLKTLEKSDAPNKN